MKDLTVNNGGKTGYYDIPGPTVEELAKEIKSHLVMSDCIAARIAECVRERILPSTLNDLIEFKRMPFWRGEAFKALYALEERAQRSADASASEERELNKVIYYCNRRLAQIEKERNSLFQNDQG